MSSGLTNRTWPRARPRSHSTPTGPRPGNGRDCGRIAAGFPHVPRRFFRKRVGDVRRREPAAPAQDSIDDDIGEIAEPVEDPTRPARHATDESPGRPETDAVGARSCRLFMERHEPRRTGGAGNRGEPVALPSPSAGSPSGCASSPACGRNSRARRNALAGRTGARGRFGRPDLRDRYIVGRATLRILLGKRLGRAPAEVELLRGAAGARRRRRGTLDFNVSHTDACAIFGFTEAIALASTSSMASAGSTSTASHGSSWRPAEQQSALIRLAPDERRRALLRLWTCKEAMSKATGDAMSARRFAAFDRRWATSCAWSPDRRRTRPARGDCSPSR